ncbi:MAG: hypothetical protein Q9201_004567 [Fulgogasparrea decipioides]
MFRSFSAHVVQFQGLAVWHIAAIWRFRSQPSARTAFSSSRSYTGCSGEVWKSRTGPGTWAWEIGEEPNEGIHVTPATGASYIEMPRAFPLNEKISAWLAAEGIFGLVWGGGKWFSSPSASRLLGYSVGVTPRSRLRRDVRSKLKGTVYAGRPPRWTYPAFIRVDGANYTHDGAGGLVYKDEAGSMLNLTQLDDRIRKVI